MTDELPLICIVGPTATGKSELGQRIAQELSGEVLSADSMQVYRGMDIGTAKVPPSLRTVPYHGVDLVDPGEPYSAALYQRHGRDILSDLEERGVPAIMVGGTGFYIKAVIDAMDFAEGEQMGNAVRERYQRFFEEQGARALWEELRKTDPQSAAVIHENDVKRVIRAFELLECGDNYSTRLTHLQTVSQAIPAIQIGIACDPDLLRARIDERVGRMRESGLVAEVESLLDRGFRKGITAPQAIGYKEIVEALDGKTTLDEAFERIQTATRRYAKRQRTWFRRDERIAWIETDLSDGDRLFEKAMDIIERTRG